ncbi:MAG: hypothetical protein JXL80_17735 [Planctomycetes bacterium]|nr:hypothetical protein [Planctomycetota bacterium]
MRKLPATSNGDKGGGVACCVWPWASLVSLLLLPGCLDTIREPFAVNQPVLEQQVLESVRRAIEDANLEAAKLDGKTFVKAYEFPRCVIFVKGRQLSRLERKAGGPLPPDAVRHNWTDRYVLAQELKYRYSLESLYGVIRDAGSEEPYHALATLRVEGENRFAVAEDAQPVPKPPEGCSYWVPRFSLGRIEGSEN